MWRPRYGSLNSALRQRSKIVLFSYVESSMRGLYRSASLFATVLIATMCASANGAEIATQRPNIAIDDSLFAAVTDGTESIGPEEMAAYWKIVRFVQDTPFEKISTQSAASDQLHSVCSEPSRHRGVGRELKLAVRRVLAYPVSTSEAGVDRLYEVWGWDEQNPNQLVVAVVPQLPEAFPTGEQVAVRATFRGLFFKLQGYTVASPRPGDRFRTAPLFVGKMVLTPETVTPFVTQADCWSLGAGGVLLASLTLTCCYGWRRGSANNKPGHSAPQPSPAWEEWLRSSHSAGAYGSSSADCR